jgi:glutathione S-transferase
MLSRKVTTLYQFMPMPNDVPQVSSSPFCAKVEAYLILTGRPYETIAGSPPFAPTKTVPYVAYGGEKFGDSQAIIDRFESETSGSYKTLEKGALSADQRSTSQEVLELVEKKLYFSLLYSKFALDQGWEHQIEEVKFGLPWILRCCLPGRIRAAQIEKCAVHGCSSADTAFSDVGAYLQRLTEVLGDQPFLFGEEPRVADCSLFGFLVNAKDTRYTNPLATAVRENDRLMDFLARMTSLLKK